MVRTAINESAPLDDADTAALFTTLSRDLDKPTGILEAQFQAKAGMVL